MTTPTSLRPVRRSASCRRSPCPPAPSALCSPGVTLTHPPRSAGLEAGEDAGRNRRSPEVRQYSIALSRTSLPPCYTGCRRVCSPGGSRGRIVDDCPQQHADVVVDLVFRALDGTG